MEPIQFVDIWRSILIGQSFFIVFWTVLILWMRFREKLRPGYMIGALAFWTGNIAAVAYVLLTTFLKLGQPADYKTILASIAVLLESFGCVVIFLHLLFHDDGFMARMKGWFKV